MVAIYSYMVLHCCYGKQFSTVCCLGASYIFMSIPLFIYACSSTFMKQVIAMKMRQLLTLQTQLTSAFAPIKIFTTSL